MRTGLIAGVVALIVVMIFIIQNAHAVNITFLCTGSSTCPPGSPLSPDRPSCC
jgi:uncharacterized integral membrane protein